MARFSKKVIRLLADELTGTVIREIDVLFENNDIPLGPPQPDDNDPGQRRERMRRYLASIDFSSPYDTLKLTRVYSDLLQEIAARKSDQFFDSIAYRDRWVRALRADGFEVDEGTWTVTDPARPAIGFATDALGALSDPTAIHDHLARLGDTIDTDPRIAVSTAKALIESTAKLVLPHAGRPIRRLQRCQPW